MDNFIEDIIEELKGINDGSHNTNKTWTIAIKKALIDVADKYGYWSNCSLGEEYKENENNEWLYDIIIYSYNDDKIFDKVYLVGESEWNSTYEQIEYDFLKLIFARAEVRLMVYQVSGNNYDKYKNNLINIIEKSNSCINGDIYLLAIYNNTTDEFKVEKYIKGENNNSTKNK